MYMLIKALIKFLLGILLFMFFSCKTQEFAKNGYFTGEVDKYFNEKEGLNVWLYRSFQPRDTGNTGLRIQKLYPLDQSMMKLAGLGKKGDKVLFSVVPENKPTYNLLAVKHKRKRFDVEDFEKKEYKKAPYYEKDYSSSGLIVKHVYIPYDHHNGLSLLFYALEIEGNLRNNPLDRFNYLAGINALEVLESKSYNPSWQIFDCDEHERKDWVLKPNPDLLKERKSMYLKLYDIYGPNKTISYFKIIKKDDVGPISLKLCPNDYELEYYDEAGSLLEKDSFKIEKNSP